MLSSRLVALLKRVSRSFYLSVRVLPAPVQTQVAVAYLLARAADTVADTLLLPPLARAEVLADLRAAVAGEAPVRLLGRLRELLSQPAAQPQTPAARAEHELLLVVGDCLDVLRQLSETDQRLIGRILAQLTHGMTVDLRRFPVAQASVPSDQVVALSTLSELDEYTYFAAGCVGEFWTDLMAQYLPGMEQLAGPELRVRGVELGKALQLVNVLRDAPADLRAGRCYWPAELLSAHGLSPVALARLAAPHAPPPSVEKARALCALAGELRALAVGACESAWPYVLAIPAGGAQVRLRLACTWPLLLGLSTLALLRQVGSPLLCPTTAIKIPRGEVYALLARSTGAALLDGRDGGQRLDRLFSTALAAASRPAGDQAPE